MKRPVGFEVPKPPPEAPSDTARAGVSPRATKSAAAKDAARKAPARGAGSKADRPGTAASSGRSEARPHVGTGAAEGRPSSQAPDPREEVRAEVKAARSASREAARAERRARADLRRATRARKRTEKNEVRRFTARRRRTRIAYLVAGGVVAALAGVVAVGAFSPLFALREVRVEGATLVAPAEIQAAVDDQLGTPLPLVDFGRIQAGLAQYPLIESYSTESLPPGTLVIRVVERTPVAVLAREGGFDLVDSAGVTVSSPTERPAGFPLIEMPDRNVASVDFQAAAKVLVALPADLRGQVDKIRASTVDDVTLTLSSGQRVVWGDSSDSAVKAQHLNRLLAQKPTEVKEYDVSSPGVGIIR